MAVAYAVVAWLVVQVVGALEALRKTVEQPEYRQEIFLRTFLKQNFWHDPVLDEPEFAELRGRLAMT